ncbi:hypothetical protein GZH47_32875 (plasmid) [Paenibacillus rhizovicinus]|uniref:Terminase n=1 Tax=Paenibacillus rhizovicinus TaxID=2704463 RepID=A0A6C0PAY7_9BACL|nr:hypothetical protein [Paenibacillus rhizovicinus]QHW35688.1 hypothetical protein GZH47_32875 [Paenibacillus rhizovicinus]
MELVHQYLELHPADRLYRSDNAYRVWDDFINADAENKCIIAGRATGKTTAILKRAILNKRDTVLVTSILDSSHRMNRFTEIARELGHEYEVLTQRNGYKEVYVNGKTIYIVSNYSYQQYRGYDLFHSKEVIFEDPENMPAVLEFLEDRREFDHLLMIANVIMVGTINGPHPTAFKSFYRRIREQGKMARRITSIEVLTMAEMAQVQREMPHDRFEREMMCEFEEGGGSYESNYQATG